MSEGKTKKKILGIDPEKVKERKRHRCMECRFSKWAPKKAEDRIRCCGKCKKEAMASRLDGETPNVPIGARARLVEGLILCEGNF